MFSLKSILARSGLAPSRFAPPAPSLSDTVDLPDLAGLPGAMPAPSAPSTPAAPARTSDTAEADLASPSILGLAAKRMFDVGAALALLLLLSPLLTVVAVLVMRDGGPCLFGHTRIGADGRKFKCLKFRSMVPDADAVLKHLLATDPVARAEWAKDFKLRHDVRVTPLGRFIRRTSIDELPQLWNVVRGDMSLVGPRPVVEKELERYGDFAAYYLRVLPGITGLWQVSGRSETDYDTRVSLDVAYVRNWSFAGDVVILFKTVGVVLRGRGAY